jgi:predicted nuclease of predicted toxin-antitoxin system
MKLKWRIYADHNIEKAVVDALRKAKFDVLWVQENHQLLREKDDKFHWNKAKQLGRYLLTHDDVGGGFWDDRRYPLKQSPGIIVMKTQDAEMGGLLVEALKYIFDRYNPLPVPLGLESIKIRVTSHGFTIKGTDHDTQKKFQEAYAWRELL